MELTTRDFSLNFRGFEHEDPETMQRFRDFCEANFDLLPEQTLQLAGPEKTVVLTHSNSPEELEALAKVLREIGALVEVAEESAPSSLEYTPLPSTQDLHRLFRQDTNVPILNDRHRSAVSPIGSSLYLLNPKAAASIEHAEMFRRRKRTRDGATAQSSNRLGVKTVAVSLLIGGMIIAAALSLQNPQGSAHKQSWNSPVSAAPPVLTATTEIKHDASKPLAGASEVAGYSVELKALVSSTAASIRSFTVTPVATKEGIVQTLKRVEGDPTFLKEISNGVWEGVLTFYVTESREGRDVRSQRQSRIVIALDKGAQTATATLSAITTQPEDTVGAQLSDEQLPFSNLSLTLTQ
jgi:hypothetical protein